MGRGGVQGWRRSVRAALTAVRRRNHSRRCPGWEEQPFAPHLRTLLAAQGQVSARNACSSTLCPAELLSPATRVQSQSQLLALTLSLQERDCRPDWRSGWMGRPTWTWHLFAPAWGLATLREPVSSCPSDHLSAQHTLPLPHQSLLNHISLCFLVPLQLETLVPTTYPSNAYMEIIVG